MPARHDISAIKARLPIADYAAGRLDKWQGAAPEFKALCPFHNEKTPSFSVRSDDAFFYCFGCGEQGDVIDLIARLENIDNNAAIARAAELAGLEPEQQQPRRPDPAPAASPASGGQAIAEWRTLAPVSADAPRKMPDHPVFGKPDARWIYRDEDGNVIGAVCRFNRPEGGKEVWPLTFCECTAPGYTSRQAAERAGAKPVAVGERRWRWRAWDAPRPLYGLDQLSEHPDWLVLLVEGEKAADAARRLFAGKRIAVVTWPGGGKALGKIDWRPLEGRNVVMWPDADQPGHDTAWGYYKGDALRAGIWQAIGTACNLRTLAPPEEHMAANDGWDAADAEAEGWDAERASVWLKAAIAAAQRRGPQVPEPPPPQDAPAPAASARPAGGRNAADRQRAAAEAAGGDDARPVIRITAGELHEIASQGEAALIAAGAPFYSRGAAIVRPVVEEVEAARGRRTNVARLANATPEMILDWLSRVAQWERFNVRKGEWLPTDPTRPVATIILSRDGEWKLLRLAGVITNPTLRPDGSILDQPGYDPGTRLVLMDPPPMSPVPSSPSRDDARRALALLNGLLDDFPFKDAASRAVALSALLTPVVRGALLVAPLHAFSAPTAGSGKSYAVDLASGIATGQRAPVIAAGRTEEETEKRLAAALLHGQPIVSIDNLNGELGGDQLCQMVERPLLEIRPLGRSELVRIESRATVFATGNNIALVGDMVRRVVRCSLDPNVERPELRRFAADPLAAVLSDRGRYIAAALTVVRAYIVAGCPDPMPPLASFEDWSRLVRSSLVWLGCADPVETIEAARADDPKTRDLREVIATWHDAIGTGVMLRAKEIIDRAEERRLPGGDSYYEPGGPELLHPDLREALFNVAAAPSGISTRRLGTWFGRNRGRVIDGLKIIEAENKHTKLSLWGLADA